MVWPLLQRGLLVGLIAGLLAGAFGFVVGEPRLQDAIDLEEAASAQAATAPVLAHISDWVVSRDAQRGGLFVASAIYGACVGVLFALAFALSRGRARARDDWQLSLSLAAALFVALVLVPFLKYPANPPGVGDPATIATRTWLYVAMLAGGLLSLVAAARVAAAVREDAPAWRRPVLAGATFALLSAFLLVVLPAMDEVPAGFPASLLWDFRLAALGTQLVLWTALGVGFGIASLRAQRRPAATGRAR